MERLLFSETENSWSILNILEHIVLSEEASLAYVLKKTSVVADLKPISVKSWLKIWLMKLVLQFKVKYKAPKHVDPIKSTITDIKELTLRWENSRDVLYDISQLSPRILEKGILKHPYAGMLNFSQLLVFFETHFEHHLVQINHLVELDQQQLGVRLSPIRVK